VSALIFVLLMRPYQVGDRVTCSDVLAGAETLLVMKVDVLSTTFLRIHNKLITVPNHTLYHQNIENFKRSPSAAYRIELIVSAMTTAAQLDQLRRRMDQYLLSQPLAWKPTCMIRAAGFRDQNIVLSLWASSHYAWQDVSPLFKAVLGLHMHLLAAMREGGIRFRQADLRLEGVVGTRVVDAVTLDKATGLSTGETPAPEAMAQAREARSDATIG
jgi:small-conductance mechanosensitive channel